MLNMNIANPQLKIPKKRKRLGLIGSDARVPPHAWRETQTQATAAWAGVAVKDAPPVSRMLGECPTLLCARGI